MLSCDMDQDWSYFRDLAWDNHDRGYPYDETLERLAHFLIKVKSFKLNFVNSITNQNKFCNCKKMFGVFIFFVLKNSKR